MAASGLRASSGMVQPGKETAFYFKVPKVEGDYPYICTFPGHYQLMNGMMGVTKKANPVTNLTYKLFHGKWSKMPDFSEFKPIKSGTLATGLFDISMREVNDNFAFVFNGKIECPKDGKYSFTVSSDDGSQLFTKYTIGSGYSSECAHTAVAESFRVHELQNRGT